MTETQHVGSNVTKHKPTTRVKAAFRKAKKADRSLTLKAWARSVADDNSDVEAWFKGKKAANLCKQRQRINTKKAKGEGKRRKR